MFRKLITVTAVAIVAVFVAPKQAKAQYAAPQLYQKIERLAKTNIYPYVVSQPSITIGSTFTNGPGRALYCVTVKSSTGIGFTNQVDFIDQTDLTTNSVNYIGNTSNVVDCLCMPASSNDVLVVSTNQSTGGTGVSIIGSFRKQ
jgi:hypothetical protein